MGIANPRPAMRSREARIVQLKLKMHAHIMNGLIAEGVDRHEASRLALVEVKETDFLALDRKLQAARREKT